MHVAPYFTDIYKDLLSREQPGAKGISRMVFLEYCGLPGIISERFFSVFDQN